MIYNLSIFGTKIFVETVSYDVNSIQTTGSLEKCGRTVFKIVSPTDNFETIKNGITLFAKLLQYFPCLLFSTIAKFFPKKYFLPSEEARKVSSSENLANLLNECR